MKGKQKGFTLIELVVVIAILATLAAVALPKFVALQADARLAKMNGALASIKAAAALAHAQLIARGFSANQNISVANSSIVVEGTVVSFVNGYPSASQIAEIAGIATPDYVLASSGSSRIIAPDVNHDGTGSNPICTVVYTEAQANQQPSYVINASLSTCQ